MTQDEIIEMTRQAGGFDATPKFLETFAQLVAQHERDKLIDAAMKAAEKGIDTAIALEREACAKISDEWAVGYPHPSTVIAEAIRARGQA